MVNKYRAIKYHIYPSAQQIELFVKTFGCARFVYNKMISFCEEKHQDGEKYPGVFGMNYELTLMKAEFDFLREVDATALTSATDALHTAFTKFFHKEARYPCFHKKKNVASYTSKCVNQNIVICDSGIRLPKAGIVKAKIHRFAPNNWVLKKATISRKSDGTFYCSVIYELPAVVIPPVDLNGKVDSIGLDYKSDGLYTDSYGNVASNHKFYRDSQKKLARLQRQLAKKEGSRKGEKKSRNWLKQQQKINKLHVHIANQRSDYLHKLSYEIANRYDIVCAETLNMKAMANKGFHNGKATMDNGYGMFLNFLEYKLQDRGKYFVKIDKWYPSSQFCHECGVLHTEMKDLSHRIMDCSCGCHLDRDHNAAINILQEGLRILYESVA